MDPVSSSEIEDTRIPTSIEVADQFTRQPFLHEQHKGMAGFPLHDLSNSSRDRCKSYQDQDFYHAMKTHIIVVNQSRM